MKTDKMLDIEQKFGKPIQVLLYDFYITNRIPATEIAPIFNVRACTVNRWLHQFNIPIRSTMEASIMCATISFRTIELKFKMPIEIILHELYVREQMTMCQIANYLGVQYQTVQKWCDQYNIPVRTRSVRAKMIWANPEYKKKLSKINQEVHSKPEVRQRHTLANFRRWSNPEYKKRMSKKFAARWQNPDFRKRSSVKLLSAKRGTLPNNSEKLINCLTPSNVLFTGDGAFWRSLPPQNKPSNPDFIIEPIKKTRKVIFFHGIYWHRNELHNRGQDLIDAWKQIGYDAMIIWEDELRNLETLTARISEFTGQATWQLSLL